MKKAAVTILIFIMTGIVTAACAQSFSNETLKYVIAYKWGIIHKEAGEAELKLQKSGNYYDITLTAKTKPWADRIYQVRDTLKGRLEAGTLRPLMYKKLTHEKGEYKIDEIEYTIGGDVTYGTAKRHRKENGKWNVRERKFSASGPVFDMLSVFYYIRQLEFVEGRIYKATIFSGRQKETITIKIMGEEKIKLKSGKERMAYKVKFSFTREGGKKSSDDMETWISADTSRIPLYLVGKLPVGEIRAYFVE